MEINIQKLKKILTGIKEDINENLNYQIEMITKDEEMNGFETTDIIHRLTVFEKITQETINNIIENTEKEIKKGKQINE